MIMQNKRLAVIIGIVGLLLLLPLAGMQFSKEVNWDGTDFLVAGVLLLGTGLGCEFVLRKVRTTRNRIIICGAILVALLLVWMELAVGIFGTPIAGS